MEDSADPELADLESADLGLGRLRNIELARQILPPGLWRALEFIFAQQLPSTMLVGGTALAGFYAGHRRSDEDQELFTGVAAAYEAAVRAVKLLPSVGASLSGEFTTALYYRCTCRLSEHTLRSLWCATITSLRSAKPFKLAPTSKWHHC